MFEVIETLILDRVDPVILFLAGKEPENLIGQSEGMYEPVVGLVAGGKYRPVSPVVEEGVEVAFLVVFPFVIRIVKTDPDRVGHVICRSKGQRGLVEAVVNLYTVL